MGRPSSSNVYAASHRQQDVRKKRPMTAAGVGKRAIQRISEPEAALNRQGEGLQSEGGLAINFEQQERPISAATYQK